MLYGAKPESAAAAECEACEPPTNPWLFMMSFSQEACFGMAGWAALSELCRTMLTAFGLGGRLRHVLDQLPGRRP